VGNPMGSRLAAGAAMLACAAAPPQPAPRAPPVWGGTVALPPRSPPAPTLPAGTRVRVPFAPPLDRPLTYYWRETRGGLGVSNQGEGLLTVRFTRAGEGFLMESRIEIRGLPPRIADSPEMRMLLRPVTFRLDGAGKFVGIDKEEEYWRTQGEILDLLAKRPGAKNEGIGRMKELFAAMRSLPLSSRVAILASKVAPITAVAGLDMAVGETMPTAEEETQLPFPGGEAKLKRRYDVALQEATAATVKVEATARFNEAAIDALLARFARIARPGALAPEAMHVSQTSSIESFRDTGLTRRYSERTAIDDASGKPAAIRTVFLGLSP
jgi:hypothetical protein